MSTDNQLILGEMIVVVAVAVEVVLLVAAGAIHLASIAENIT